MSKNSALKEIDVINQEIDRLGDRYIESKLRLAMVEFLTDDGSYKGMVEIFHMPEGGWVWQMPELEGNFVVSNENAIATITYV